MTGTGDVDQGRDEADGRRGGGVRSQRRGRGRAGTVLALVATVPVACSPPRPDATFGDGGYAQVGAQRVGWGPKRVVVQTDGKVLTLVSAEDGSNSVLIVRHLADGRLDSGFGTGGVAIEDRFAGPEAGYAIAAGPDGKLVVAGEVPDTTGGSPLNRHDLGIYRFERP